MDPGEDWALLVGLDAPTLLLSLAETSQALGQLHIEYGMLRGQEKRAKVEGFNRAAGEAVTARQYSADTNAVVITESVFSVESQIKELQEKQGLLNTILDHR